MRESTTILRLALNALVVCAFLFMNACSSNSDLNSTSKQSANSNKASKIPVKVKDKDFKHTHPSNPCTEALEHSHPFENKDHKHRYNCESTNEFVTNGHVHEATKKYRRFRHVHPNGANKHSHHRE